MNYLKKIWCYLLLTSILFSGLIIFLLTTRPGFTLLATTVSQLIPGTLHLKKGKGYFFTAFSVAAFDYENDAIKINGDQVLIQWKVKELLFSHLSFENLLIDELNITIKDKEKLLRHHFLKDFLQRFSQGVTVKQLAIKKMQFNIEERSYSLQNIQLQAELKAGQLELNTFHANKGAVTLSLQGQAKLTSPYPLSLRGEINAKKTSFSPLDGHFSLQGDYSLYHSRLQLISPATVTFDAFLKQGARLDGTLYWRDMTLGSPANHLVLLKNSQGSIQIHGTRSPLTLDVSALITSPFPLKWQSHLESTGMGVRINNTAEFSQGPFTASLVYDKTANPQIIGQAQLGKNKLRVQGTPHLAWQLEGQLLTPYLLHPSFNALHTPISLQGSLAPNHQGMLKMTIHPGEYQLSEAHSFPLHGALEANLSPQQLQIKGQFNLNKTDKLTLFFNLPTFRFLPIDQKQVIQGEATFNTNNLSFVEDKQVGIMQPEGKLSLALRTKGTIGHPQMKGELTLRNASVYLPNLGLHINPIDLQLESNNGNFSVKGTLSSQNKSLNLTGSGMLFPKFCGNLRLSADEFPLINTPEYHIDASPLLNIAFSPNLMMLTGTIKIPKAQINPHSFNHTITLTPDVVFINQTPTIQLPIEADVLLEMGNAVSLSAKGLNSFIGGHVYLRKKIEKPLVVQGELHLNQGKYHAFGQNLLVEEGQLLFNNSSLSNPKIHVRAIRHINTATAFNGTKNLFNFKTDNLQNITLGEKFVVGVEAKGELNSPKIQLFSIPSALSQADILSLLLLGKPASQASQAGGQLLLTAISAMKLNQGTNGMQLINQLKKTLGFNFALESQSDYNPTTKQMSENNALVIGKSITKHLYLSYNYRLTQANNNAFTLTYLLNKFFSIQMNTSTIGNSIDLLYSQQNKK